jgi:hypothetical protein
MEKAFGNEAMFHISEYLISLRDEPKQQSVMTEREEAERHVVIAFR